MDVAILGASGDCGREIAAQVAGSRLLAPTERLQLVGRSESQSAAVLHGLVSDITDAHAEYVPEIDVALEADDIVADIWVVSCGKTPSTGISGKPVTRTELGKGNAAIFQKYADALSRHGNGSELIVIVSNPVELGVEIFSKVIGRRNVIGIGAYSDTLRFRREIAADLGVRRQRVSGFMIGEHGEDQLPVWSSVEIHDLNTDETAAAIKQLRQGCTLNNFHSLVTHERMEMGKLLSAGQFSETYNRLNQLPPDVRVIIKPILTHMTGAKTVMATANVTVDLLRTLLDGREMLVAGQVQLAGDFHDLHGPLGVPVIVGPNGIQRVFEIPLESDELATIRAINQSVNERMKNWLAHSK